MGAAMTWFKLDDQGAFHAKVLAAGNEAYGAWVRAGQWSSAQLTDGLVEFVVAKQIAPTKVWRRLIDARLVDEDPLGYRIHDFLDWNPSAAEVRAARDATSEARSRAGRAGGQKSGETRRSKHEANTKQLASTDASVCYEANEAKRSPVPTRPIKKNPPPPHVEAYRWGGVAPAGGADDGAATPGLRLAVGGGHFVGGSG